MPTKRTLLAAVCSAVLLSLTGCLPGQVRDDRDASFFVTHGGEGYQPTGYGWKPNTKVEFSVWNEPDGRGSASTQWKRVLEVNVDGLGMFGFNSGAQVYPVRRTICGTPEQGQTMVFMAKSLATGTVRMRQSPVDLYFTFQPCR